MGGRGTGWAKDTIAMDLEEGCTVREAGKESLIAGTLVF